MNVALLFTTGGNILVDAQAGTFTQAHSRRTDKEPCCTYFIYVSTEARMNAAPNLPQAGTFSKPHALLSLKQYTKWPFLPSTKSLLLNSIAGTCYKPVNKFRSVSKNKIWQFPVRKLPSICLTFQVLCRHLQPNTCCQVVYGCITIVRLKKSVRLEWLIGFTTECFPYSRIRIFGRAFERLKKRKSVKK